MPNRQSSKRFFGSWCLLLVLFFLLLVWEAPGTDAQNLWRRWPDPGSPTLSETIINITVVAGRTATMPCRVANLGDKTVSWIRGVDLTVLAVDRIPYTGDSRFTVKHPEDTNDWILELRDVTSADEGLYDCQINTHPKLSTKVYLDVVPRHSVESSLIDMAVSDTDSASRAADDVTKSASKEPLYSESIRGSHDSINISIQGEKLVNKKVGETLKLVCKAKGKGVDLFTATRSSEEELLHWILDEVPVKNLFAEWKVKVRERSSSSDEVTSTLTIDPLVADDTGKITCFSPHSEAPSASVSLHVIEEQSTEQHYSGTSSTSDTKVRKDRHKQPYQLTSAVSSVGKKGTSTIKGSPSSSSCCPGGNCLVNFLLILAFHSVFADSVIPVVTSLIAVLQHFSDVTVMSLVKIPYSAIYEFWS